jgi:hypothetical protein
MHRTRRLSHESGSLRDAAEDAEHWSRQLDRLKAEAPGVTPVTSDEAGGTRAAPPDSGDFAAPEESGAGWAAEADAAPPRGADAPSPPLPRGFPFLIGPNRQRPSADGHDAPPADANGPVQYDGSQQPAGDGRMIDDALAGPNAGPAEPNRSAGASDQQIERLLEQVTQQLTAIRQTLEKILAKPGNVVMD